MAQSQAKQKQSRNNAGLVFQPRAGLKSTRPDLLDFSDCRLFLATVSCGNIGQLALDIILCSLVKGNSVGAEATGGQTKTNGDQDTGRKDQQTRDGDADGGDDGAGTICHHVGTIFSRHVDPAVCRRDYGLKSFGQLASAIEVYRHGHNVFVHQRSPISEGVGHTTGFVTALAAWIASSKFSSIVLLGGASAVMRSDEDLQAESSQYNYILAHASTPSRMESGPESSTGDSLFGAQPVDKLLQELHQIGVRRLARRELLLTGMLKPLIHALTRASLSVPSGTSAEGGATPVAKKAPVLGLILSCTEGINFAEGSEMAQYVNRLFHVLPPFMNKEVNAGWRVPASWQRQPARPNAAIY